MYECSKCKKLKSPPEFFTDRSKPRGTVSRCRDCTSEAKERRTCTRCHEVKSVASQFWNGKHVCKDCYIASGKKCCTNCTNMLPLNAFYEGAGKGGIVSVCKECQYTLHRAEQIDRYRCRTYGLRRGDYERMVKRQNRRCAVCRKEVNLHIDHCHAKGHVRGLLCQDCNLGLGRFKDDPSLLRTAAEYLEEHQDAEG